MPFPVSRNARSRPTAFPIAARLLSFDSRSRLDGFLSALQSVIARHDILRTGVMWEGLPEPVQVVLREAVLPVEEFVPDPDEGEAADQLKDRFDPRHYRLDVTQAPLLAAKIARDESKDRWLMLLLFQHMAVDHEGMEIVQQEVAAHLLGDVAGLPAPVPFRDYVGQARLGRSVAADEAFFGEMLGSVEEPTLPYGLADVQGDGRGIGEAILPVEADLGRRLRAQARTLGVSAASLFHLAWGRVLGGLSGREDVVFGTVLLGRHQGVAERALGMFINTLPLRLELDCTVAEAVRRTQHRLAELLAHEHASLALAQRC
ncbi:MAG: condensation domain-containing protein, partial [Maritimibacter sp.]